MVDRWDQMNGDKQRTALLDASNAAEKGDLAQLRKSVEEVGVPLQQTFFGKTLLAIAVSRKNIEAAEYLLGKSSGNGEYVSVAEELSLSMEMAKKASHTAEILATEKMLELVAKHVVKHGNEDGEIAQNALGMLDIKRLERSKETSFSQVVGRLHKIASGGTGDSLRNTMVYKKGSRVIINKTF